MESKFGRRLEAARHAKRLTRAELSATIGVSESLLRDMEIRSSAARQIYDILPRLSAALNVSLSWLLTGKEIEKAAQVIKHAEAIKSLADQIVSSVRD